MNGLRKVGNVCKMEDGWKRAVQMRLDIEAWRLTCCILSRNIARMLFIILEMKKFLQGSVTRGGESGKFSLNKKCTTLTIILLKPHRFYLLTMMLDVKKLALCS